MTEQVRDMGDAYMHGWKLGYHNATLAHRNFVIELAEARICFDHKTGCDHGGCHALAELIEKIREDQN